MPGARNFFSSQEQELIISAIAKAEEHTSGEIRLHLQDYCFTDELKAAQKIFVKLKMHETKERNGVLIFIATRSHKIAVIGDEGIHKKLGAEYWQALVQNLISQFRANKKAEALAECILECGRQLGKFFPREGDDRNELDNTISFRK